MTTVLECRAAVTARPKCSGPGTVVVTTGEWGAAVAAVTDGMAIRATGPRLLRAGLRARASARAVRIARCAARIANGSREKPFAFFDPPDVVFFDPPDAVGAIALATFEG
ncbi:MAG TPA: hypothetical protein VMS00_00775 [Acidimicrobiales bacterium]|nr:hypothetical protein [Acidimicrobiales bacterium]